MLSSVKSRARPNIRKDAAWLELRAYCKANPTLSAARLCAEDSRRFAKFSLRLDDLLLDFSKTTLTADSVSLLLRTTKEAEVFARRDAMFAGEAVNKTEDRAALHIALRAAPNAKIVCGGKNIIPSVVAAREEMLDFANSIRKEKKLTDVVNIGIGGAHLGPETAAAALQPYADGLRAHFISNPDGAQIADILAPLNPRRTLVVVSSKSFATAETIANAKHARRWLTSALGAKAAKKHLVAASTNPKRALQFGVGRVFAYADWVGGRYSVWGAAGLPLALAIGKKRFLDFLAGARAMDSHFVSAPPQKNLPLMLALVGVWHRNFCGYSSRAILPYDWRLRFLPAYLQQLDMESNGKVGRELSAPIVWGSAAADAQHSYFQFLHQGADIAPCEFIIAARGQGGVARRRMLVANCLAQSAALMTGDTASDSPHCRFVGGRPSVTIMQRNLSPYSLGRLLALFEHRTFAESVLWGTNPFDQWGVQLGKTLAARLLRDIVLTKSGGIADSPAVADSSATADSAAAPSDISTRALLQHYRHLAGG